MESNEGTVAGLFGRTVAETLDLARKEQHNLKQVMVVGVTTDGVVKSFKTRMPYGDMALMNKFMDVQLTNDITRALENL